jgi:hypothetical protein
MDCSISCPNEKLRQYSVVECYTCEGMFTSSLFDEEVGMDLSFLNPINTIVEIVIKLRDAWNNERDRTDREKASISADLLALLNELGKTHTMIVMLVSPLRRIDDSNHQTFARDFTAVYNDFRDTYDAHGFIEERTHCHKLGPILTRLERYKPRFGSQDQWSDLHNLIVRLQSLEGDIIGRQYRPFMMRFDQTMRTIEQYVRSNQFAEAIREKNEFLNNLEPDYNRDKAMLEVMTNMIGEFTANL